MRHPLPNVLRQGSQEIRKYLCCKFGVFKIFEQCNFVWFITAMIFFWSDIFIFFSWRLGLLFFTYFLMWIYFDAVLLVLSLIKWNFNLHWGSIWNDGKHFALFKKFVFEKCVFINIITICSSAMNEKEGTKICIVFVIWQKPKRLVINQSFHRFVVLIRFFVLLLSLLVLFSFKYKIY